MSCLSSKDPLVTVCALDQLHQLLRHRSGVSSPTSEDICNFINSGIDPLERQRRDVKSLWSDVRLSLQLLNLSIDLSGDHPVLSLDESTVFDKNHLNANLRKLLNHRHLSSLLSAQDQGKVFNLASVSPISNYWLHSGHYVSFAEYRFGIKARCNLLPVRSVLARIGRPPLIYDAASVTLGICRLYDRLVCLVNTPYYSVVYVVLML